jgi:hypothetical protein
MAKSTYVPIVRQRNPFAQLSAENGVHRLAVVASNEIAFDIAPVVRAEAIVKRDLSQVNHDDLCPMDDTQLDRLASHLTRFIRTSYGRNR